MATPIDTTQVQQATFQEYRLLAAASTRGVDVFGGCPDPYGWPYVEFAVTLTRAEKMQVANLAPSTAVEVHLVVECCSERLGDEMAERVARVARERADPAHAAAAEAGARESEPEEAAPAPKRPRRGQSAT